VIAVSDDRHDIERFADQSIDMIPTMIGWIGTRTGGIAALVRRYCKIPCLSCRVDLRIPEEPRYTETIQHDDERDIVHAADRYVEDHAQCRLYAACLNR